jgi:23S rRNA (cytosine1962-C5)-methyltransferase
MQTLSAGMATRKDDVARLLRDITGVSAVYLRNDPKSLAQEGVPQETRYLFGEGRSVVSIDEGSARFEVDIVRGHKTGWFCDQRENRLAVAGLVQGAHVLDAFCHTGGFSIHAALGGATSVTGIDVSSDAVAAACRHAELNGVSNRCRFEIGDVFETLRAMERAGRRFDLVILDPPAFARAKPAVARALAGYKDINLLACRLLKPEGVLISCSCSHHVSEAQLCDAIRAAAHDARRTLRVLEIRGQARDHPVLADMPETRYLKCFLLQVV